MSTISDVKSLDEQMKVACRRMNEDRYYLPILRRHDLDRLHYDEQ